MKASARNQLSGKITALNTGVIYTEVSMVLGGGSELVASVTNDSAMALGLALGMDVLALIKAPLVMIVKDFGGYRLSARNQLQGSVSAVLKGSVNSEILIELQGGEVIASSITNESVELMELKKADTVTAVFKAGAVILAIKG